MDHIQLAYDLLVIMIGLAALSIAAFWAFKTGEIYLRDFSILYSLFTLVLILSMVVKYLSLNMSAVSAPAGFFLIGLRQIASFGVLAAAIHFLHRLYGVRAGRVITILLLAFLGACAVAIFTPIGARLEESGRAMILGAGYRVGAAGYFISFTYLIGLGFGLIGRIWRTDKRAFVLGLMIFAAIGWLETLAGFPANFSQPRLVLADSGYFLFSSIPYALYGVFLIYYFLNRFEPAVPAAFEVTPDFLARYGITGREAEIIGGIVKGKSNAAIAGELFISLATVKTHLHNIYQKVGVDSRFDLLSRIRSGK
jgi:DNA-binding CsgD family transcriptional regulator